MILGLFVTSTSCQDSLTIPQKNVYDTEEYYKNANADDAEKLIASIYRSIFDYQGVGVAMWLNIIIAILFFGEAFNQVFADEKKNSLPAEDQSSATENAF